MKPKISTGYLTPKKKTQTPVNFQEIDENAPDYPQKLLTELLRCPDKQKQFLKLMADNKEFIDEHKRNLNSPAAKVKTKQSRIESPTMLMTRRALERMNSPSPSSSYSSRAPSPSSESSSSSNTTSFENVLKGVVAYVEIVNRAGEDRSEGAKNILRIMGAKIRDKLSRDVTHVVFKDGGYTTFQQAKLIKAHLVSVLWVDSCRRTCQRQNEKHFPAMRTYLGNDTFVNSQFQKEYEDMVREEFKRSVETGTPLPSSQNVINRRRTMMVPRDSSGSSYHTAQSDKDDDGSVQSVTPVRVLRSIENSDMDLTCPHQTTSRTTFANRRKTMCNSLMSDSTMSNSEPTVTKQHSYKRRSSMSESESFNFGKSSVKPKASEVQSTEMSALAVSSDGKTHTEMSLLQLSKRNSDEVVSSVMSSLNISSHTSDAAMTTSTNIKALNRDNINTKRGTCSAGSDDSEILSPLPKTNAQSRRKTVGMVTSSKLVIDDDVIVAEDAIKLVDSKICRTRRRTIQTQPPEPRRRVRKLYNPDLIDSLLMEEVNDEEERQEKRNLVKKRKSDEALKDNFNPLLLFKPIEKPLPKTPPAEDVTPSPPKRLKRTRKPSQKVMNNSRDEQKDLLEEVLKNKQMGPPKTPRRKQTVVKVAITPVNRRSTLEFITPSQMSSTKKKAHKKIDKIPSIVCTKLHRDEVQVFTQIVKKLGRFQVEDEVTNRTTHVVAGESKRTINMLRGVARGCWILRYEWVLKSIEARHWLPEEDYEVTDFSPAVQKCRLERQAFGSTYQMDVFATCPPIFVSLDTTPRCSDLRELIHTCGGRVVTTLKRAKVVVGRWVQDMVCVNERWVLDCIVANKLFKFDKYVIKERISLVV